ncbi:hypothetical protein [Variovorax sp. RO1]|uniref:hypothetical protein n=1 Tax=Variovorax sp. RO1 TaxID=2066034 RepID=UPI00117CA799|nr:hypothetical protein [Variovorax sp. RO1]
MKKFLRIFYLLPLSFIFSACLHASEAESFNLCDSIKFKTSGFSLSKLQSSLDDEKCQKWKNAEARVLAVKLERENGDSEQRNQKEKKPYLYARKDRTTPPGPIFDFVKYEAKGKRYLFDESKFLQAVNEWPVYQQRATEVIKESGGVINPDAKIQHWRNNSGDFLVCTIIYRNQKNEPQFMEKHFSFFKRNRISAAYSSALLRVNDSVALEEVDAVEKLFRSIELVQ